MPRRVSSKQYIWFLGATRRSLSEPQSPRPISLVTQASSARMPALMRIALVRKRISLLRRERCCTWTSHGLFNWRHRANDDKFWRYVSISLSAEIAWKYLSRERVGVIFDSDEKILQKKSTAYGKTEFGNTSDFPGKRGERFSSHISIISVILN